MDGVDVVVHYDPPEDHKMYVHRSGRTARAGEGGMVVTLVLSEQRRDVAVLQRDGGTNYSVVEMRAGDSRLLDLASWSAPRDAAGPDRGGDANGGIAGRRPNGRQPSKPRNGRGRSSGGGPRPAERRPARAHRR